MDCNEKKFLTKLYQELELLATENLFPESSALNSSICCYLETLCEQVPYFLNYDTELLPSRIMKLVDLKFETEAVTLLEQIVEYLGVTSKLFPSKVMIFVNLKLFLTEHELQSLYEYVFYNKISMILIEGYVSSVRSEEKLTIIDMDKCVISL